MLRRCLLVQATFARPPSSLGLDECIPRRFDDLEREHCELHTWLTCRITDSLSLHLEQFEYAQRVRPTLC